jgi:hypothetical protein
MRSADHIEQCQNLEAKRKTYSHRVLRILTHLGHCTLRNPGYRLASQQSERKLRLWRMEG